VIAPSYGDIFRNNTLKNAMLPVTLPLDQCRAIADVARTGAEVEVDLEKLEIRCPGLDTISFTLEEFPRHCLLNGLDDIGLTLQKVAAIEEFETRRSELWPWLDGFGYQKRVPLAVGGAKQKQMDW
jgi:3-isopropylmalate dehydratase